MAEEFFKGLGRYIPPEIRRFAPAVKTVTELLRPTQIVKNPAVSNLVRSPSLANVGNVLSNAAMTAAEVVPGGKLITTPVKKVSKLASDLIEQSTTKGKLADVIKDPTTPVNKILLELGDEKISKMTIGEVTDYVRKKGVNVAYSTIGAKKLNFKASKGTGSGNKTDKLNEAFNSIENPNQYTVEELKNLPQIQKIINENNISFETFNRVRRKSGIESKPITFIDTFNVNEDEFINFLQQNPKATLTQIKANFPKIKKLSYEQLKNWRDSKNISKITNKKDKTILQETNPRLQSQLDFVSQSGDKVLPSNIPIKHNEAFSEIITMNKKTGPLDATRTKIVQAHGIGEGGISNTSKEIIKSKVAMIPEDFLKDEKLPQFFLTRSGNIKHRDIENNLILALVNKYDKLGYNFVEGAWKQTKKVNPKSITKELKNLENEIAGYQDELNKLDAYTLFYNPVKDKMVTHGKPLSEIPGLSNLLNQVKKGTNPYKKLKGGGLVGISHLTRPL
jgi:hypothetical protein